MRQLAVFLHVFGSALWLGASFAFMVIGPAAKRMPLEAWAHTWQAVARVQRVIVAPAAAIVVVTGLVLTMSLARQGLQLGAATCLMVMQGFGLVAGIVTLAFVTPLMNRMAAVARRSLDKGQVEPAAERVRKAIAISSSIAGALMLVALWFGVTRQ